MTRADEDRRSAQAAINSLTEALAELCDQLRAEQKVMAAMTKNHGDLQPAIHDFANQLAGALALRREVRVLTQAMAREAELRPSRAA